MSIEELFIASKDTDTERVCGTCGQLKSVDAFYKDGKDPKGRIKYRRDCKDCYKKTRIKEAKLKKEGKAHGTRRV